MSLGSRRELVKQIVPRYRVSTWKEKGRILDEFLVGTGYARKHAITLLNGGISDQEHESRTRRRRYDNPIHEALVSVWKAANRICSKRLIPFLPEFVAALERFGHLTLPDDVRSRLLAMSASTADRLLHRERNPAGKSVSTTRPGKLLKHQIPIRTFSDWSEVAPGFMEADLVAHCGDRAEGAFLNTLVLTDISTGWTECLALLRRSEADVAAAIHGVRPTLPFPLLGLDTDNGGEFINYELLRYCEKEKITFTRSRAYHKNDQAHVEEKNGSVVRRLVGYDRYEGMKAWRALTELYEALRLYVNFFQPSMKLLSKEKTGGRTTKRYDTARTPYQRVLDSSAVGEVQKSNLGAFYARLDPVGLLGQLERLQDQFWAYAHQRGKPCVPSVPTEVTGQQTLLATAIPKLICTPPPTTPQLHAARQSSTRTYRRTRRPAVPRTWRTRIDPFAAVWGQIQIQLGIDPTRTAKELFQDVQHRHPGRFPEGQLRTLQRRVQAWRRTYLDPCDSNNGVDAHPILHVPDGQLSSVPTMAQHAASVPAGDRRGS